MDTTPLIKTKHDKEYHRRKAMEYYQNCKQNGKYKQYLEKKNQKYKEDPEFREMLKNKSKLRYHRDKIKKQELLNSIQA